MGKQITRYKISVVSLAIELIALALLLIEVNVGDYNPMVGAALVEVCRVCMVVTIIDVMRNLR